MEKLYENPEIAIYHDEIKHLLSFERDEEKKIFDSSEISLLSCLPLLNKDNSKLRENFILKLKETGMTDFLQKLLSFALECNSKYWIDCALLWINNDLMNEKMHSDLKEIYFDKRYSQKTRHSAMKIMNKWKRESSPRN